MRKSGFYIVRPKQIQDWMECNSEGLTVCFFSEPECDGDKGGFTFSGVPDYVASYSELDFVFISDKPLMLAYEEKGVCNS